MRAWVCEETSESFPSGERILTATPGTALWDAAPACEATNAVHTTCDPATPTVPGMSVASSFGDVGVYLECSDSAQSLLGGLPGVVSECFNGSWTPVSDMCTEGCETPRDCSWVAQTGFTGVLSTDYLVIPEGVPGGQVLSVKCELTSVLHHNDGGWTLVLDQYSTDICDALLPGQNFMNCDPGTCQAVAFTGNAPFWGDYFLEAKTKIFFRPKDYDERKTSLNVLYCSRSLSSCLRYNDMPARARPSTYTAKEQTFPCLDLPALWETFGAVTGFMREGPAGGPRVDRGTVDYYLSLIIKLSRVSERLRPLANGRPASTSSSPVASGIVEASRKCSVKNASLAIVKDPTDLSHLVNGTYYFTAHTFSKGTMYPEVADLVTNGFMCYGDSGCTSEKWAWNVAVTMDGGFKLNSALANLNYICMLPAWCPESYTEHNGQCYKVLEANSDLPAALASCNEEGSALAYPEDSATVEFLRDLAKRSVIWDNGMTEAQLALGISFEWDDPTIGGMYTISDDLLAAANTSTDDPLALEGLTGRLLTVDRNADTWAFTPTSLFNVTTYAICQYKGPVGCWMAPPTDQNKTTGVQYNNGIVSELVTYNCKPGYFTMGERGNKTVQSLECIGQLGGWWPSDEDYLIPCYGLDVCFDEQTPLPDMSVTNNLTFRYHTFGLSYKCNFASMGMTTLDLRVTQRYTCTEMTNATYNGTHVGEFNYTYGFMPDEDLLHCNRCSVAPSIAGATHTFSSTEVYEIGDTITATCHASYLLELDVTEQTVTCQNNGWSYRGCVRVCLETPVIVNATTDHQHDMWEVGEVVTATCNGDLYFADAQVQTRAVKCTFNGWVVTPGCETVCKDQPVVVNATVDWSTTRMRKVGETVTATCLPGHGITGARTETVQQVKCTDHDWEQKPACELLVCTDTPTVGNATVAWSPGLWLVGQVINATCLDGHRLLSDGSAVQELACTMDGWEVKPACKIACVDEPDLGNATSTWTSRLWLEGETVDATCAADHLDVNGNTQQTVECTENGWHDPSPCLYVPPGVIICTGEPEVTNAVTDWFVGVWVSGSSVNATCLQNHYALAEGGDVTVQTIACTDDGWENKSACVRVCERSPGDFGVATTSWEDRKYQINETVFATCQDNYLLANDSVNQTVTCTESGWETPSPCLQVQCPAPVVSNSVETFNGSAWNVSEEVVVSCLDDHFVRRGVQVQTLECGADRTWGEVLPCVRGEVQSRSLSLSKHPQDQMGYLRSSDFLCRLGNRWVQTRVYETSLLLGVRQEVLSYSGMISSQAFRPLAYAYRFIATCFCLFVTTKRGDDGAVTRCPGGAPWCGRRGACVGVAPSPRCHGDGRFLQPPGTGRRPGVREVGLPSGIFGTAGARLMLRGAASPPSSARLRSAKPPSLVTRTARTRAAVGPSYREADPPPEVEEQLARDNQDSRTSPLLVVSKRTERKTFISHRLNKPTTTTTTTREEESERPNNNSGIPSLPWVCGGARVSTKAHTVGTYWHCGSVAPQSSGVQSAGAMFGVTGDVSRQSDDGVTDGGVTTE
ncbi:uncharacterized protein LOC122255825 [Penaeus japonicus]|uniref:uncharacterized protein LOC122255825 n=1 Tax=Penaeus japonicus TaxID=27405 RepID=UPI001C7174DA|nr:uncharacterized protein LOC122255825 [Penaeus japonicus]